jgi:uncharacterized membrane protein YbhN (UPF0104 family)
LNGRQVYELAHPNVSAKAMLRVRGRAYSVDSGDAGERDVQDRPSAENEMNLALQSSRWRSVALRVAGSGVILATLLAVLPRERVWAAMRSVPPGLWLAVLAGYLAGHVLGVMKYRMMVNVAGAELSYAQAAQCYFGGLFGNLFLPSIAGGDIVRVGIGLRLTRRRTAFLLGSLLDRMLDIAALAVVAAVGALLIPGQLESHGRRVFLVLMLTSAVAGVAALGVAALFSARRAPYKLRRRLVRLRQAARSLRQRPQYVFLGLCTGVTVQSIFVILTAVLASACGLHLGLRLWLLAWPLAKLAALTPLTQGGLGVREVALAALLAPFGAPAALTVAVGLVWQTISITGGLLAGLLSLGSKRVLAGERAEAEGAASAGPRVAPALGAIGEGKNRIGVHRS